MDPVNELDLAQAAAVAGESPAAFIIRVQQQDLPGPCWRKVLVGGRWRWGQRWSRRGLELRLAERKLARVMNMKKPPGICIPPAAIESQRWVH